MMVQDSPTLKQDFIFLLQTKSRNLEHLISDSFDEDNILLVSVENSAELADHQLDGKIVTFIIGSDVEDPIQSAQRLHAFSKDAKIILLAKSETSSKNLNEAIKFSPFIGTDVTCMVESKKIEFEAELYRILQESLKAERYRAIIAESNSQVSSLKAPQEPAYNQHFINKLLDITPVGIAIINQERKILGWNKEAANIFNDKEVQVLGTQFSDLFKNADTNQLNKYLNDSFDLTEHSKTLNVERKRPDQSWQFLSITAAPFTYAEGNAKALVLAMKDETEREEARMKLQEINLTLEERVEERTSALIAYQEQLRSLATKLSKAEEHERQRLATELHDNLGQMLAVTKMKISLLQKKHLPEEATVEINNIKSGVEDAIIYTRHLMSDLKPPPSLNEKDIRASIRWLTKKMVKHDLHVTIEDDGQPKPVSDEVRTLIVQCVRELFFNIIKHAEVNKAVLKLFQVEDEIIITVEDKGVGFEVENERSTSQNSGFGLFNIVERVDFLGGSVDIVSEPGVGTKVTLCVPLNEDE